MKRILGFAALLAFTATHASELKFGDLNYFLPQGRANISANIDRVTAEEVVARTKSETEGNLISTKAAFAIEDNLNLFVGLNYSYDMGVKPEGGSEYFNDGINNPIFGLNFRAANQSQGGFNLDFGAIVRLGIEDVKKGSSNGGGNKNDGNAAERSSLELNGRLGNKWNEANEFYTKAALVYNQSGEEKVRGNNATPTVNSDHNASYDLSVGAFYQYRPVNEFMTTVGAEAIRVGGVDGDVGGQDFEIQAHYNYLFSFSAKYLITENFIASVNFVGSRLSDVKTESSALGDSKSSNRRYSSMGLGLDFLF